MIAVLSPVYHELITGWSMFDAVQLRLALPQNSLVQDQKAGIPVYKFWRISLEELALQNGDPHKFDGNNNGIGCEEK